MSPTETTKLIQPQTRTDTSVRLKKLLGNAWKNVWKKSPPQKRRATEHKGRRSHDSAYRLLQKARDAAKSSKPSRRR